jgi:hypothetical protein
MGSAADPQLDRIVHLNEAKDALAYAQEVIKIRYNRDHLPLSLEPGDKVFVRLHKGYKVSSKIHKKLGTQRIG